VKMLDTDYMSNGTFLEETFIFVNNVYTKNLSSVLPKQNIEYMIKKYQDNGY